MQRTVIKIVVATIVAVATSGGVWYAWQPRLVCDEPVVVRKAMPIAKEQRFFEHTYLLRNRSFKKMKLDSVKSSCTCQSLEVSNSVIPPWGTCKIIARFNVERNVAGLRHAETLVFANQRPYPILRLQMQYSFELGMWLYPEQVELGRIVIG